MLQKATRQELNDAGWDFHAFSTTAKATEVRQEVEHCREDTNITGVCVAGGGSAVATVVATCIFPPLGVAVGFCGLFLTSISVTHQEAATDAMQNHLTPYKTHTKALHYLKEFQQTVQGQQALLKDIKTARGSQNRLVAAWDKAIQFLDALPSYPLATKIQTLKNERVTILGALRQISVKNPRNNLATCRQSMQKILSTLEEMVIIQRSEATRRLQQFQQRFEPVHNEG